MARRSAPEPAESRAALIDAARVLFAERGYTATSLEQVARRAGLSRGALAHHFRGKRELFEAVFEALEQELDRHARRAAAARSDDALEAFLAGCGAYFRFAARAEYQQIALADAPGVLGREHWHRVDSGLGLRTIEVGLEALMDSGHLDRAPLRPLAVLMVGALNQGGFAVGRREPGVDPDTLLASLRRMLERLGPGSRRAQRGRPARLHPAVERRHR